MSPCKRHASCLKSKEIEKADGRFDLRIMPNYLKVKTMAGSLCRPALLYDGRSMLDSETKTVEHDHADELRLWLRRLTCQTRMGVAVRSRLRERFDVTLPRFDLMAQLDRAPDGMTLSDVSKRMMVSNGNVTGLVERLVESGHLDRRTSDSDRRVQVIRLTKLGRAEFRRMAAEHETWIADIFSELTPKDVRELMGLLAKEKGSGTTYAGRRVP